MSRPFIEFLQSQLIDWHDDQRRSGRTGVEIKTLSRDDETDAATLLVRYPPGFSGPPVEWCSADEEIFVLNGDITLNGRRYTRHHYAYWPAGFVRRDLTAGPDGATLIVCFSAMPAYLADPEDAPSFEADALVEQLDPFALTWDRTNMDPNIAHLNAWRKNLRLGPNDAGRTYLLAGLPQGFPIDGAEPLERHPHVEEMFMVAGDMACSLGIMQAGSYFWRPPQIWHGADCTINGFLLFARTPGSNRTISEWAGERHPVTFEPVHRPVLPAGMEDAGRPIEDLVRY